VITPEERDRRKQAWEAEKANRLYRDGYSQEEAKKSEKHVEQCRSFYPWVLNCSENGKVFGNACKASKINFTDFAQVERLFVHLIASGEFILNPAAHPVYGAEFEERYGDELHGPHALSYCPLLISVD
jgi:hypothetical protein